MALEKVIINDHKGVSSFFERNFLGRNGKINSNNMFLKNVDSALDLFYQNNKCFPSSLSALNLDITNLGAIYRGLIRDRNEKSIKFFDAAIKNRNLCMHSDQISNQEFKFMCNKLRKIVELCPHVDDGEKQIYLLKLNYILDNLIISDAQSIYKDLNEAIAKCNNKIDTLEEYVKKSLKKIEGQDQGVMQMIQDMNNKLTLIASQVVQYEKRFEDNENAIKDLQHQQKEIKTKKLTLLLNKFLRIKNKNFDD
jgi:hypothetical protein